MHRFVIILFCLAASMAEAGYLPAVGAPALRFKFAYKGELATLPPLIKAEPEIARAATNSVVAVTNAVAVAAVTNAPAQTNEIVMVPNLTNSATNKVASVVMETKTEAEPLPPQVLMQFFRDRANTNTTTTVVGAVGFTPPPTMTPPSSRATFEKR